VALRILLLLVTCGMLFAAGDKGAAQKAQCIADCKNKCNRADATCKKNATNKTAVEACQKSLQLCTSHCANKACS